MVLAERLREVQKLAQARTAHVWSTNSRVSVCLVPKAILHLSPSVPLPRRGWSSTSGSQMTLPSQERRQRPGVPVAGGGGRGKGAGGWRGGTGGDGQRNWLASFPLAWRPSPGQLGAELPSPPSFFWETMCFSLGWRWVLQTAHLIVKVWECE